MYQVVLTFNLKDFNLEDTQAFAKIKGQTQTPEVECVSQEIYALEKE